MKKTKSKPVKSGDKPTLIAFLLDRSGSMESCKAETISGFNAYIKTLQEKENGSSRFTLTQFDTIGVDIIHDAVPLKSVAKLNNENYQPRANTPLYDAMGKTIRAVEAKAGNTYKVLFVTQTDGQENASSEWTSTTIKELIKNKESNSHWTFAYLGMGPDGWAATLAVAAGTRSVQNVMRTTGKNSEKAYRAMAGCTISYMANVGACGQTVGNLMEGEEDQT